MDKVNDIATDQPLPVNDGLSQAERDSKLGLQNAANDMGQAMARLMGMAPLNIAEFMMNAKLMSAQLDALVEVLFAGNSISKMAFWDQCSENVRNITKDIQTAIGQVSLIARPAGPLPKTPKSN